MTNENPKIVRRGSFLFDEIQQVGEFGPGAPNEINPAIQASWDDEDDEEITNEAVEAVVAAEGYDVNITVWRFPVWSSLWCALSAWYGMHPGDLHAAMENGDMSDKIRSAFMTNTGDEDSDYVYFAAGSNGPIEEILNGNGDGAEEGRFVNRFALVDLKA